MQKQRKLIVSALALGGFSILGCASVGYLAYETSRRNLVRTVYEDSLSLARSYASSAAAAEGTDTPRALTELRHAWAGAESPFAGAYMCVVRRDGKLVLNTRRPDAVGADVGHLQVEEDHHPEPLSVLLEKRKDWVGQFRSLDGEPQVTAFAYIADIDAYVAVHIPVASIQSSISAASLPWLIGLTVVGGVLFPLAFGLLYVAFVASRREGQEAGERHRRWLSTTLSSIGQAVITADPAGRVTFLNPAAARLTGWGQEEASDRPLDEVLRLVDEEGGQRVDGLSAERSTALLLARDGTRSPVDVVARPIGDASDPLGVVLALRDLSADRAREAQLLQAQKMEAIGRLAAGLAHDFNNLLTVVGGYAELLRRKSPSVAADRILTATEQAAALTQQLLSFSKQSMARPVPLDLNRSVEEAKQLLTMATGEDVELACDLAPGLWPVVCDPSQVQQVLLNLAVNARDAMPNGGRLTFSTRNVERAEGAGYPAGRVVVLTVRDTGLGIPAEDQERIFEPFFTTKAKSGTGLGLSTVFGIVQASGGAIRVESEVGDGTCFVLELPAADREVEPRTRATAEARAGAGTLLLVDDEENVREVLAALLSEAGYEVLTASSGEEAIAVWEGSRERIGLLVTDVAMPGMRGDRLASTLRERDASLGVLFMSGYAAGQGLEQALLEPCTDLLHKPFSNGALLERIALLLSRQVAST